MKRILFVDDELDLLQGLRDALRRRRKEWEMVFVTSGQEALQRMQEQAFDLIVTDMRMPGMDGAELLAAVSQRHPAVSRVVLTGHAERESMTRASALAQQILSKPCDGATLQQALDRLLAARAHTANDQVRELVGKVTSLPSVPWVHRDLVAAARSDTCRADEIAALLETDPGLTARVLHLANAACFGDHERLHSALAAIRFLGLAQVSALLLLARTFEMVERLPQARGFDVAGWQQQSLRCASLARALCPDHLDADDAYVAGLLHDIGQVVLMIASPAGHAEVLRRVAEEGLPACVAERQTLGVGHDEVGAHLLDCWGLDEAVVAAVARHHALPAGTGEALAEDPANRLCRVLHTAHGIVNDLSSLPGDGAARLAWLRQRPALAEASPEVLDRLLTVLAHQAAAGPAATPLGATPHSTTPVAPTRVQPATEPGHAAAAG